MRRTSPHCDTLKWLQLASLQNAKIHVSQRVPTDLQGCSHTLIDALTGPPRVNHALNDSPTPPIRFDTVNWISLLNFLMFSIVLWFC